MLSLAWITRAVVVSLCGLAILHFLVRFDFFVPHAVRLTDRSLPVKRRGTFSLAIGLAILLLWAALFLLPILMFGVRTFAVDSVSNILQVSWMTRIVVICLVAMSAWAVLIIIDRLIRFRAAQRESREFAAASVHVMHNGETTEILKIAKRYKRSPVAGSIVKAIEELRKEQIAMPDTTDQNELSKRALERAEAIVHAELKRGVSTLATIGALAPFSGLIGTVIGITQAFKHIAMSKSTGVGALAGGIAEALIITAVGLVVALPTVWMFNYFTNRLEAFDTEMGNNRTENRKVLERVAGEHI
jgi:biopolymer transport protein ExbB/biopolymer transport protein TolQ